MLYEVSVSRAFTASHSVVLPDGSLEPMHEHLWHVTATFRAARLGEPTGFVVDFTRVEQTLGTIARELEGAVLNSLEAFSDDRCSAERVAEFLCRRLTDRLDGLTPYRVSVTEAPGCSAAFYPNGA